MPLVGSCAPILTVQLEKHDNDLQKFIKAQDLQKLFTANGGDLTLG